jgi:hypothetical protein
MLDQILDKMGLKYEDLTPEEKKTYHAMGATLTAPEPTLDDVKRFLSIELERANHELHDFDAGPKKQSYYQAYATLCEALQAFLSGASRQREELRRRLKQQFNIDI